MCISGRLFSRNYDSPGAELMQRSEIRNPSGAEFVVLRTRNGLHRSTR